MKRSESGMYKDSPRRFERYLLRLLSRLPFLPDRLLRRLAPDLHRRRKEQWEFEWQTKQWASLYHDSGTKAKVLEYWNRFRFLSEIRRVLKPGGHFVLTCETFAADVGKRNIGHAHSLALKTLLGLLHGFENGRSLEVTMDRIERLNIGDAPTGQEEQILLLRKPPSTQ